VCVCILYLLIILSVLFQLSFKRNEAHKLWLDLEKRYSSTSVGAAVEKDLNKTRQMVLTAKKVKRDAEIFIRWRGWSANKETEEKKI